MIQCPHCSGEFNPQARRPRSTPAHRRYFGMIKAAYENWPEKHRLPAVNVEAVRTFLQLRAGWGHQVHNPTTGEVYLIPKSICFREMSQADFNELSERVSRILAEEIGISGDDLLLAQKQLQCA